ncbi:aquaporin SIP1-1-like [Punica granatum]|uniref:Aquaporin SIP1-1-like n=1 Tax=Punica granatum TaxID=22663 RepID=A0A218WM42_PUNGR|nr:aquaporin SIP1-1-like [Punica granatum]OWM73430.1 hypothetical protein CDL15_Pgr026529 [Punica granatum]
MGAIKPAVADRIMTFGWVFCTSTLGAATMVIAFLLGLNQDVLPWASLAITMALVFVLIIVFEVIGGAIGEASSTPPPQRRSTPISRGRWTGTCQVEQRGAGGGTVEGEEEDDE